MSTDLARSTWTYTLGAVLSKSLGFILIPIYTKYFTVEEYGILSILNVLSQLLTFMFLFGISSAAMRFYFGKEADEGYRQRLYGNALTLILLLSVMLVCITGPLLWSVTVKFVQAIPFYPYVLLALLISFLKPIISLTYGLLRVQNRAKTYVSYNVSFFVVQTCVIIWAVVGLHYGLQGQLYSQLLVHVIFGLIAFAILMKHIRFFFSLTLSRKLLKFGLSLVPFFVFTWINAASGRFLLERYVSLKEVGLFALAAQFSGVLILFGTAAGNAFMPYFYETAQQSDGARVLGAFSTKFVALFGMLALLIYISAKPAIMFIADPKFFDSIRYVPYLLVVGLLSIIYNVFHWNLMHAKKTALISKIVGVSAGLTVVLSMLFLKQWQLGIMGVIYAMMIVQAGLVIAGYFFSQTHFRLEFEAGQLGRICLLLAVGGGLIHLIQYPSSSLVEMLLRVILFVGVGFFVANKAGISSLRQLMPLRAG